MKLPTYWENTRVGKFDGAVWYRKKIVIPKSWIGKELVLELGPIDDMDRSYVNGTFVGGIEEAGYYDKPRVYNVPATIVNDTVLTLAVRVLDTGGGGGLWGDNVKMQIHPKGSNQNVALSGEWKYLPVAEYIKDRFYVYGIPNREFDQRPMLPFGLDENTPTVLYNGMIAPLIPFYIKGTIWYQGEQNVNAPKDYESYHALFSMLIHNWRADWNEGNFPFYFVQIAPWTYGSSSKSYVVRNAQFETLSVPNTGMAVTLDIGSLKTIHPPDKQDVGKRLALWALAKQYHKDVFYSGPLYKSMKIKGSKIILSFEHTGEGLALKEINGKTNFIIAGRDQKFVDAQVKIEGKKLVVYSDKVKDPVAVRYAWSNTAEATLFNKEGFPSPTFKTDNWTDK
jgi:sialate O-acetylesterase